MVSDDAMVVAVGALEGNGNSVPQWDIILMKERSRVILWTE